MKTNTIFSTQLIQAMVKKGFTSTQTPSGVCTQKLAEITGTSTHICERYLQGEEVPSNEKILKLAHALDVSPGVLLFGRHHQANATGHDNILISKELLSYMIKKYHELDWGLIPDKDEMPGFLNDLIDDISHIEAPIDTQKRLADLAFNSVYLKYP
jgi:transcriptional regulator with XRE-family HTH domain